MTNLTTEDILSQMSTLLEWQAESMHLCGQLLDKLPIMEKEWSSLRSQIDSMDEFLRTANLQNRILILDQFLFLKQMIAGTSDPITPVTPPTLPLNTNLQLGNFLWMDSTPVDGLYTSMTLMSDYLHNGLTANRSASDAYRIQIIERAKREGNTIHIYAVNDTNYSRRRGESFGWWDNIPDRRLCFDPSDFSHWYHWFVECRKAGLKIVVWLWPNDAVDTYNNPYEWPNDAVVNQMLKTIEFCHSTWEGQPLCTDFVLKLEADDEWSISRINTIASKLSSKLLDTETLWYHNQTADINSLLGINWNLFDGFRYQWMNASSLTDSEFTLQLATAITSLPSHLKWVGSEYTIDGSSPEAKQRGDLILSLRAIFPQIIGVDNGCTYPLPV